MYRALWHCWSCHCGYCNMDWRRSFSLCFSSLLSIPMQTKLPVVEMKKIMLFENMDSIWIIRYRAGTTIACIFLYPCILSRFALLCFHRFFYFGRRNSISGFRTMGCFLCKVCQWFQLQYKCVSKIRFSGFMVVIPIACGSWFCCGCSFCRQ